MVNYGMSASDREHHSLIEPIHYVPPNIHVLYTCTCGTVRESGPKNRIWLRYVAVKYNVHT